MGNCRYQLPFQDEFNFVVLSLNVALLLRHRRGLLSPGALGREPVFSGKRLRQYPCMIAEVIGDDDHQSRWRRTRVQSSTSCPKSAFKDEFSGIGFTLTRHLVAQTTRKQGGLLVNNRPLF